MDTTMELDDFKSAWQALDARLARHEQLQTALLGAQRRDQSRRNLRPLVIGMLLQGVLGIGLVLLGVACWTRNTEIPGLLATGLLLHAFGILHVAFAGIVIGLANTLDYGAPVLAIQKRLRRLLRVQVLNSNACGAPWWIGWVLVVVGVSGLSTTPLAGPTPAWIWISLALGVVGMVATWTWAARGSRGPQARMDDGADGIRRNLRLFDELERFERE
ncbi:MAG TPA: hypothetical protein VN205_04885 [Thermomonas sp.]|nr:hypothetical protein [Thermomonas sp.]